MEEANCECAIEEESLRGMLVMRRRRRMWCACCYLEVEKRKKGEVSLKANVLWAARASAHIVLKTMIVDGLMSLVPRPECSDTSTFPQS